MLLVIPGSHAFIFSTVIPLIVLWLILYQLYSAIRSSFVVWKLLATPRSLSSENSGDGDERSGGGDEHDSVEDSDDVR